MVLASPVTYRPTVLALLSLTFATGLVDAISVLVLGHVFVANMTGNLIFLGFWFVPNTGVDLTAAAVALMSFVAGAVMGGRLVRRFGDDVRRWLAIALGGEAAVLLGLSGLAGAGVLDYHGSGRLILITGLAVAFGAQSVLARQFGIPELSTTVLTMTIVGIGSDSRMAGGSGEREKLRYLVVFTMVAGAAVGATLSRFVVAPVIALAAVSVVVGLAVLRHGPRAEPDRPDQDRVSDPRIVR